MHATGLDESVLTAVDELRDLRIPEPEVLLLLGTGRGTLPSGISNLGTLALGDLTTCPAAWRGGELLHGRLGRLSVWLIEDAPGDLEFGEGGPAAPAWERGWPMWLASAMGADLAVVTAAGGALSEILRPGTLTVLADHVNLSGQTPLLGLGETRLGPLFPDQSLVHCEGLREAALQKAGERGIELTEVVAALVAGPALTTPAERRWYRTAGAHVFVQGLAGPLLAAAHAGVTTLSLVAVTEALDEPLSMAALVARAEACAPALEDLILALLPDLAAAATELAEDLS